MKRLLILVFAMSMTIAVTAQITWNAKLGGGFAMCVSDNKKDDLKSKFVGKIGVGIEKPLSANFSLMPSLEVAMKGTRWLYRDDNYIDNNGFSYEETLSPIYIQIPLLGAYRFYLDGYWNLTLKLGPYFAYGIGGKIEGSGNGNTDNVSYTTSTNGDMFSDRYGTKQRFDAGVDVGLDFEYHRFVFGIEYERGFVSYSTYYMNSDIINQAAYITIGYKL